MMAMAVRPSDHRNAVPNAMAWPVRPMAWCALIWVEGIMARMAVPKEPPICWAIRVTLLA